jgi:hypothetical protein
MSEPVKSDHDRKIDEAVRQEERHQAEAVRQEERHQAEAVKSRLMIVQVSKRRSIVVYLKGLTDFCAGHVLRGKQVHGPATREQCQQFCTDVNRGIIDRKTLDELVF